MRAPGFLRGIRSKLLGIALFLLLIPAIGYRFVIGMEGYLSDAHRQSLLTSARMLSAALSDRGPLFRNPENAPDANREAGEEERRRLIALFGSADPETAADLGPAYKPSREIERILGVVSVAGSRIWVLDGEAQVRGMAGSLASGAPGSGERSPATWLRAMLEAIAGRASGTAAQAPASEAEARALVMRQVDRALDGEPSVRVRRGSAASGPIVSVAQPVWQGESIVGAVVLEESSSSAQSLKRAALDALMVSSGLVLLAGVAALLAYAWWITSRVRRLQRAATASIDAQGRVQAASLRDLAGDAENPPAGDEIDDLRTTLAMALNRLARYNAHLESLAARLAHELRTPVAVVRSSLDNLRQAGTPDGASPYVDRADEGIRRMSVLISRLSEASQLERMLEGAEVAAVALDQVLHGCIEGYRAAYAPRAFELALSGTPPFEVRGVADALVQMLDKLIANANDFAAAGTPVRILLHAMPAQLELRVQNEGPAIAPDVLAGLFDSLVSHRTKPGEHLGLGLYIVRIIAEFHGGRVRAANLEAGDGVEFAVTLPR
jgi:signal transduction histidine kinase